MVSDTVYDLCLPILQDEALEEEDKTEKLEELLRRETPLIGNPLENAILDVLWHFRDSADPSTSSPPVRHTVVRRPSPAPWQMPRASTPLASPPLSGVSTAPPPGFGIAPPAFKRAISFTASPFISPRASPRPAFSSPAIPHSPSLNAYEFSESSPTPEIYGDYGSDTVDWLVNDDTASNASSTGGGVGGESGLSGAAAAWIQPQQTDMSPYDMLRSVLGDGKSDEEIEMALEMNGYDLSATVLTLMEGQLPETQQAIFDQTGTILVGKSMTPNPPRPETPSCQGRSGVVCRFWLSTGTCLRADCRFSHDLSNHICKYWVMGNCLAGDTCIFSHDPANLVNRLAMDDNGAVIESPELRNVQSNFQLQDYNSFPSLQSMGTDQWSSPYQDPAASLGFPGMYGSAGLMPPPPGFKPAYLFEGDSLSQHSQSGTSSRPQSRGTTPSVPAVDDTDAFPTLGSAIKGGKKHHGKRGGHGHGHNKENREVLPSSLADVVRMSPSPSPAQARRPGMKTNKSFTGSRENSAAAQAIPSPQHVPWLETGDGANKLYLKARQDAIKHGGLRNKFLQSAAQAWNRNDARAAKALSLRGQSENDLMRKAHREAARQLYEERNKDTSAGGELYVDLHGLHPEEAVEYLERVLLDQSSSARPVYAITGTGHHSKNGKDKVGKAIRGFLNEWKYAYREFSVPGDRNNVGGILGVDSRSWDRGGGVAGAGEGVGGVAASSPLGDRAAMAVRNGGDGSPPMAKARMAVVGKERIKETPPGKGKS
ncbi:MAG: hypothetical protein M1827_004344 [Pycnora praestabilis]|nr:MAG: hypothetical protein M1827_004344 [Pycnora praestabilis]